MSSGRVMCLGQTRATNVKMNTESELLRNCIGSVSGKTKKKQLQQLIARQYIAFWFSCMQTVSHLLHLAPEHSDAVNWRGSSLIAPSGNNKVFFFSFNHFSTIHSAASTMEWHLSVRHSQGQRR